MAVAFLIAALTAVLVQEAGPGAVVAAGKSEPPVAARGHSPGDFAGTWEYNEAESINAATGRPETARAVNDRRGVGSAPAPAPAVPLPSGPAAAGGPPPSGHAGWGATHDALYNIFILQRDTQRDLMEIAPRLRFDITSAGVTITDDLDRVLTFPTDGKKQKYQLGAAIFEAKTYWDGGQLKMDIEGPDGLKITETWFLNEDASRMYLIIRVGEPVKDEPPVGVNRVYNRIG